MLERTSGRFQGNKTHLGRQRVVVDNTEYSPTGKRGARHSRLKQQLISSPLSQTCPSAGLGSGKVAMMPGVTTKQTARPPPKGRCKKPKDIDNVRRSADTFQRRHDKEARYHQGASSLQTCSADLPEATPTSCSGQPAPNNIPDTIGGQQHKAGRC